MNTRKFEAHDPTKTALQRAFELAASGQCVTVQEIRYQLNTEGYAGDQVVGSSLSKQLRELIKKAENANRT